MSTYTDIRYDYNLPSGFGGGLTLLSTQTASSSSSISFTSGIDSSYRTYMFKFINMHPQNDDISLVFNGSSDGGSNYNVTKTTTYFESVHNESDSTASLGYLTSADKAQSTADQQILRVPGNDNDQSASGTMYLFSPSSTTFVKHFLSISSSYTGSDYEANAFVSGYFNTNSAIDAVIFKFTSGNIDSGVIKMYGIA